MKKIEINSKITVIGGDERQVYCGTHLADMGYEVILYGFEKYKEDIGLCKRACSIKDAVLNSSIIILPIMAGHNECFITAPFGVNAIDIRKIAESLNSDMYVFVGKGNDALTEIIEQKKIMCFDYCLREEFAISNACLTAESALAVAEENLRFSLRDASVLVMGYGRIGKMLCHLLKAMGVNVYASARKVNDFEWIRAFGYSPVDTSKVCDVVSECKVIFNTIPNLVLGERELYCMPKDCLIIDLASKPGGVDFDAAKKLGLKVIWALALPGKRLPVSAGKAVADTILNILEDEGALL